MLSKTWFAHKFSHSLRGDQKEFLQLILDKHMAKAMNGYTQDAMVVATALDILEQGMTLHKHYATHSPSRLQTIIDTLRKELGPVEISSTDRNNCVDQVKGLLSKRKLSDSFKNSINRYDPALPTQRKQPSYSSLANPPPKR